MCAYANNQHDLSAEVTEDPAQTSFRKAIDLAQGTISIVDTNAVCFTRIWCDFEIACTLADELEEDRGPQGRGRGGR